MSSTLGARIAAVRPAVMRVGLAVVALSIALGWAYHAGHAAGVSHERERAVDSVRTVIADSSQAIEKRMATRVVAIQHADSSAVVARAKHDTIAKRIVPVTDSTVSIDGGAPVTEVPASLVIPEMHTCQQAIAADTIDTNLIRAQLAEMTKDRDLQTARWKLDEANTPGTPVFGVVDRVVAGVFTVALVVWHFAR